MDVRKTNGLKLEAEGALKLAALVVCAVILLRHAWVCDDAFITLRTVRNVLAGDGLRWNLHERVQGFTHPLWALVLAIVYAVIQEPMATAFVASLAVSIATLGVIVYRLPLPTPVLLLVLTLVMSSKSFVDYSGSGLENPLTHLLVVLLVAEHLRGVDTHVDRVRASRRCALRVTLLSSLLALNRLDAMLLALPFLLSAYARLRDTLAGAVKTLVLGLLPLLAWEAFATIYFGFPLPNTAYAKLGSQVPAAQLWLQGVHYHLSQLQFDPMSVLTIAFALALLVVRPTAGHRPLGIAVFLYLVYVTSVGGDFMAGRFFSAPTVVSALLVGVLLRSSLEGLRRASAIPAAVVFLVGQWLTPHPTFGAVDYPLSINPISRELWDERGVCDERAYYSTSSALLRSSRTTAIPGDWRMARGLAIPADAAVSLAQVGVAGFFAPKTAIIIDGYGLNDAFLARLPAADKSKWRVGHYVRALPKGYVESLQQDKNVIAEPRIAQLYDRIRRVVSGPIWDGERWAEIARLNLGLGPAQPTRAFVPASPAAKKVKPARDPGPATETRPSRGANIGPSSREPF